MPSPVLVVDEPVANPPVALPAVPVLAALGLADAEVFGVVVDAAGSDDPPVSSAPHAVVKL